jgi:MerR family mercuric resistance operon transcriptional regulator
MDKTMTPKTPSLSIGALSRHTDCNIETIRYYERIGMLPEPPRTGGGHRLYGNDHLKRLLFIRRSRELGFTLEDVRGLLCLVDSGHYTCAEIKRTTLAQLRSVQSKLADLQRLERVLEQMASQCPGDDEPDCPVIEALFGGSNKAPVAARF